MTLDEFDGYIRGMHAYIATQLTQLDGVDDALAANHGLVDWCYGAIVGRDPIRVRLDPLPAS